MMPTSFFCVYSTRGLPQLLDLAGGDTSHEGVGRHVFGDHGTGGDDAVGTDMDAGQDDGVGTYPYVVADVDGPRLDTLLVDALVAVLKAVVQGRHRDALGQVDVAADGDGADDGVMNADA